MFTITNIKTNNYTKLPQFILIFTLTSILLMTCSDTGSGSGEELTVTLTEIARTDITTDQGTKKSVRDRWGLFTLSANQAITGYRIGVIPRGTAVTSLDPATDLNVKVYNIGTTPINIILATRLNTGMLGFFYSVDKSATGYTPGVYMDISTTDNNVLTNGHYAGGTTGATRHLFRDSLLEPGANYQVYGATSGGTPTLLLEFTTDAIATYSNISSGATSNFWRALEPLLNTLTITINARNYEIYPAPTMRIPADSMHLRTSTSNNTWLAETDLNLSITVRPTAKEFLFYAGRFDEYGNNLANYVKTFYLVSYRVNWASNTMPLTQIASNSGTLIWNPTINYQQ